MEAAKHQVILLRNNSGALPDSTGRVVRYGLGNISKKKNEEFKSSDYIAITPVLITPDMVGKTIGVFTAVEVKEENWTFNPKDKREAAQKNFIDFVTARGGLAGFCNNVDTLLRIIKK